MTTPQPDPLAALPAPLRDQILTMLTSLPIGWRVIQVRKDAGDWVVTIERVSGSLSGPTACAHHRGGRSE